MESMVDVPSLFQNMPRVSSILDEIYNGVDATLHSMNVPVRASLLQGCLPLLMNELPADILCTRVGEKKYQQLRNWRHQMSIVSLWYSIEMKNVLQAITAAHIPVMVLKGADIATTLYLHADIRYFDDVDVLVQPKDVAKTIAILQSLGFSYHQEYRFEEISKQRAAFVYIKKVLTCYVMIELHISPHSNELGVSFDVDGIWQRARPITVFGVPILGMGLEDLLLYLCWHFRSHTFDRLIWLYDIAMMLQVYGDKLNWGSVFRLARKHGLLATLYYTVAWCKELWNITVPEEAYIEHYAPPIQVRYLIERFINTSAHAVLRRTAVQQRKLLQHLMVDTIKRLVLVELRTIFPSPTHLGRLYMEKSPLPLKLYWLYYFIHPFIAIKEAMQVLKA